MPGLRVAATAVLLSTLGIVSADGGPLRAQTGGRDPARCEALTRFRLPGLEITSAKLVPMAPPGTVRLNAFTPETIGVALPEHCLVQGMINRRKGVGGVEYGIGFALALPSNWNGRFLYQGGGGLNGSVPPPLGAAAAGATPALARGFAVISQDSGHKGAVFDNSFMKDQQAALDFAYNSVGKATETGRSIASEYYGRPPERTYSAGCSTGGREGMLAAESYPLLFDGVIAGAPAMRTGYATIGINNAAIAFNQAAPKDSSGKPITARTFTDEQRKLLSDAVAAQCDAKDGLKDGLIFDLDACRFDPAVLQCKPGSKGGGCLSAPQVTAVRKAFAGAKDSSGRQVYPRYPYDLGMFGTTGLTFIPSNAPSPLGPPNLATSLDVDRAVENVRADDVQNMTDTAYWTNLSTFYGRGGKIIFFHGQSDPWFSVFDTADYFTRLNAANPGSNSSRFYTVPSMSHCNGGPSLDRFDLLTALVDWVEKGVAPTSVVATGPAFPGRSRPLCPYPQHAVYRGSGNPEDAASFECRG